MRAKIKLVALNGVLTSKPFEVRRSQIGQPIYFAHTNKFRNMIFGTVMPIEVRWRKLQFEFTGRTYKQGNQVIIYEYELTEV